MMSLTYFRVTVASVIVVTVTTLSQQLIAQQQKQDTTMPVSQSTTSSSELHNAAALLDRTFAAHLDHGTLREALALMAAKTGVRFAYAPQHVPLDKSVSLVASSITVRDALAVVLSETGYEAVPSPSGSIRLEPVGNVDVHPRPAVMPQGTATLSGYVRDSVTKAAIPQVTIRVDGTVLEAKSGSDGSYKITGLTAGEYRVTARRVGYIARTRTITIVDGQSMQLEFPLNPPATKLDEVVTTAAGELRRYQVGNVISTINVDSLTPTAPVTSVTDILSGRAPGVEVVETSGLVGGGEAIRIRGQSSLAMQSDPIVIVDGVRQDNSPGGTSYALTGLMAPRPSRINDLDFTQIATIDILKGPAATAEYGTDAANGVIIITTKRGTSGSPQWHASTTQAATLTPHNFPNYYTSWGHMADGTGNGAVCPLSVSPYGAFSTASLQGNCVVDSVTAFNPLNHAAYSPFGTAPNSSYDIDVGGGNDALRYYLAGGISKAIGSTHLPQVFESAANAIGYPPSMFSPNSENQQSLRGNTSIRLSNVTDAQVDVAYMSTYQDAPSGLQLEGPAIGVSLPGAEYNYGYGGFPYATSSYLAGSRSGTPIAQLGRESTEQTDRFTGGFNVNWRPSPWAAFRFAAGVDHGSQEAQSLVYPQAAYYQGQGKNRGSIELGNGINDVYTADFRGTITVPVTATLRSATSLGAQLSDSRNQGVKAVANQLSANNFTYNGAPSYSANVQTINRATVLGAYFEEVLSLADRLFLTGSLRADAGSNFGDDYNSQFYPGVQVSWIALNEKAATLRFRGAVGGSGQQPPFGSSLQQYTIVTTQGPGLTANPRTGYTLANVGNALLKPERSVEYEGGLDAAFFDNRVSVDVSGYSKTTYHALNSQSLGFDMNNLNYEQNLGEIRNSGIEATITATVVQARAFRWTATLNASENTNKLVSLAPGLITQRACTLDCYSDQYFAAGYPLYGFWGSRVQYADINHDGVIEPDEVTADTNASYLGSSLPKQEISLQNYFGFWHDLMTIGVLVDVRNDFLVENTSIGSTYQSGAGLRAENEMTAPLWQQAQVVSNNIEYTNGVLSSQFENGSYIRFRELSLTYNLPRRFSHSLHVANLSLTGAVRNLALWTHYSWGDPEVTSAWGSGFSENFGAKTYTENNDLRAGGFSAIPLTRTWDVRVNIGL